MQVVFYTWSAEFDETAFPRFVTLLPGAMLTTGRRTVIRVVRVVGELVDTDPSSYHRVLSLRRWSITDCGRNTATFQEVRACLGVETTHGWIERTVLRVEPCLFVLYSVVVLWYAVLPEYDRQQQQPTWPGKTMVTFSDAITLVRRDLWQRRIFATPRLQAAPAKTHPQPETSTHQHTHTGNVMAKVDPRRFVICLCTLSDDVKETGQWIL